MRSFEPAQTAPLALGEDGTIRIVGSRVTLDSIVHQFKQGATAEQIHEDFPSLSLREVYGAIAYYLDHTQEVEQYLTEQERDEKASRKQIESKNDVQILRKRIQARRSPVK